jgi:hypothetical protein
MNKKTLAIVGLMAVGLTIILIAVFYGDHGGNGGGSGGGDHGGNGGGSGGGDHGGNGGGSGGTKPDKDCDGDCQAWLDAHNKYRDSPLVWDANLAAQAKDYAGQLNSAGHIQHGDMCNPNCTGSQCSGGQKCGQNLEQSPGPVPAGSAVDRWYAECPGYKSPPSTPAEFNSQGEVFHYTQVVWKGAKKVGCGMVGNVSNCLYDRGNLLGDFPGNVPPPGTCGGAHSSFKSGIDTFDKKCS